MTGVQTCALPISITAPEEEIIKRLTNRLACKNCKSIFSKEEIEGLTSCPKCGAENSFYQRKDDTEKVIKNRISVFNKNTKPVLDYYKGKREVIYIDGNDSVENISKKILNTLEVHLNNVKN